MVAFLILVIILSLSLCLVSEIAWDNETCVGAWSDTWSGFLLPPYHPRTDSQQPRPPARAPARWPLPSLCSALLWGVICPFLTQAHGCTRALIAIPLAGVWGESPLPVVVGLWDFLPPGLEMEHRCSSLQEREPGRCQAPCALMMPQASLEDLHLLSWAHFMPGRVSPSFQSFWVVLVSSGQRKASSRDKAGNTNHVILEILHIS